MSNIIRNKKFSVRKGGIITNNKDLSDPILRCGDCKAINYLHDIEENGACKSCLCIKFKRVLRITDAEFDMLKTDRLVSEQFLSEFVPIERVIEEKKNEIERGENG